MKLSEYIGYKNSDDLITKSWWWFITKNNEFHYFYCNKYIPSMYENRVNDDTYVFDGESHYSENNVLSITYTDDVAKIHFSDDDVFIEVSINQRVFGTLIFSHPFYKNYTEEAI